MTRNQTVQNYYIFCAKIIEFDKNIKTQKILKKIFKKVLTMVIKCDIIILRITYVQIRFIP